jgi:hypothetical protein
MDLKCPLMDHVLKACFPDAMFIGGVFGKSLDHEGSDFISGLNHEWIHNLTALLRSDGH